MTSDIGSLIQTTFLGLTLILLGAGAHRRWPVIRWPVVIVASALLFLAMLRLAGYGGLRVVMPRSLYQALDLASFVLVAIGLFLCVRRLFAGPAAKDVAEPR